MIDVDFGPVFVAIFISYTIVFLYGFAIVLIPSMFLFRILKKRPLWSHRPLFALTLLLSVLGGFLTHQVQLTRNRAWNRAEEDAFMAKYHAFGKKMEQEYPLEIKYQPDQTYDQQFKLIFSVPVSGNYDVHVFGFPGEESKHGAVLGDEIIEVHQYRLPLEAGNNEVAFGFTDYDSWVRTNQSIDFIVIIQPEIVREKLINTQRGTVVTNQGSVVLTEGINYYSSNLFGGSYACRNNIYQSVPCIEHNRLHITVSK